MKTYTTDELATILAQHKEWRISGGASGARAYLADADLVRADLAGANLAGAYLADADLVRADLADANLVGADLADANLVGADLAGADLAGADLAGAYLAGANLAGADLVRADLADANLAGADLVRADLADANLAGAYLVGADLAGAYLVGADLADADLVGADLAGAYLVGADLAGADLVGANLAGANLAGAYLAGADLAGARNVPAGTEKTDPPTAYVRKEPTPEVLAERAKAFRERNPGVPVVEALDAKILHAVTLGGGVLDMGVWHKDDNVCGTTHCRAGWAIHLAGDAGAALEKAHGPERAGRMIYRASTGRVPHFFATNSRALEDIKACAAQTPTERTR